MKGPGEHGLELVDSNMKLQLIKRRNEERFVLDLLVRATPPPTSAGKKQQLDAIVYYEPVIYDLSKPPVYAVDQQGVVFESQSSSSSSLVGPGFLTQESKIVKNPRLKAVVEEQNEGYDGSVASEEEGHYDSDNNPYYMGSSWLLRT
ncbi:hypothetical protein D1007_02085 [Hordeum vulgare]|nr:hypothetical protein D1007_02085 [Hordeum vulgare]